MSLKQPVHRLARSANAMPTFTASVRPRVLHIRPVLLHRTMFGWLRPRKEPQVLDPLSERFRTSKQDKNSLPAPPTTGDLAEGNIFDDGTPKPAGAKGAATTSGSPPLSRRDPNNMALALDPRPNARKRWERKMVIRDLRKGQRVNKTTLLARTERQHTLKSHDFKTSLKKLMPLARQIRGKPIEEAIVQMRFSKKKVAADVLAHLERARDEATVAAGMGLGEAQRKMAEEAGDKVPDSQKMLVIDKKGVKRLVADKTQIYVDQAWIGRGTPDHGIIRQAQGRRSRSDQPFTSLTVQLKEEKTRIRQQNERADREAAKKPWVNLPDRPVTRQTQYPLW